MSIDYEGIPHLNPDRYNDSAGRPWAGRAFESNDWSQDDGSAPAALMAAIAEFRAGNLGPQAVIDAFRSSRVLIPLLADLGDAELGAHGQLVEKSADLSIVTVQGPDGQTVLPVFSSVQTLQAWNPTARPVPVEPVKAALAAASEQTNRIVLDPGSESEFVIRRPAIEAIAKGVVWLPPEEREDVHEAFRSAIKGENDVFAYALQAGDPEARLVGNELLALFRVKAGLTEAVLNQTMNRVFAALTESAAFAEAVDSVAVKIIPAAS